jgi:hypothetical protein
MLNNNFVNLRKNFDTRSRKALQTGIKLQGRSFTCKDLQMVKIKCSKDDERVHKLANLFIANGLPVEKILVRRSGSACESYLLFICHLYLLAVLQYEYTMTCLYVMLVADRCKMHNILFVKC